MAMAEPIAIPTEDPENIEENGRLSRSSEAQKDQQSLLRKRDSSWDKKWQQHLEKNVGEQELPRSSIFTRSPRLPGKVNRSLWETRLAQEANGKPQAKPNVIRNWKSPGTASPAQNKSGTASPRPHYGAALMDYSPSRNSTPSNLEVLPPLPPPPQKPHENEVEDTNEMPYVNNIEETDNDCGDWKDEMCEEILRARHKLLADGAESNRMESVIRLLEQTYERLTQDPELNARDLSSKSEEVVENGHPEPPQEASLPSFQEDANPQLNQLECVLDDQEEDEEKQLHSLSRSISGTFQAIPARVIEDDAVFEHDSKLANDRRQFCQNMLAQDTLGQAIETVKQNKVNLMAEIRSQVQQVPAVDEVYSFEPTKKAVKYQPVVLMDTFSMDETDEKSTKSQSSKSSEVKMETSFSSQTKHEISEERYEKVSKVAKVEPSKSSQVKTKSQSNSMVMKSQVREEKFQQNSYEIEQKVAKVKPTKQAEFEQNLQEVQPKVATVKPSKPAEVRVENQSNSSQSIEEKFEQISQEFEAKIEPSKPTEVKVENQSNSNMMKNQIIDEKFEQISQEFQEIHEETKFVTKEVIDESSSIVYAEEDNDESASMAYSEEPPKVEKPVTNQFQSLPRHFSPSSPNKLKMFEASQKEKAFSISGIWSKISLGLVKERSSFWQNSDENKRTRPNYVIPKKNSKKRNSRLIDPNEWMEVQNQQADKAPKKPPLHKSLSVGQLDVEEESVSENMPASQATIVFEARANGRKSADIFVHNAAETKEIMEENDEETNDRVTPSPPPPPPATAKIDMEKIQSPMPPPPPVSKVELPAPQRPVSPKPPPAQRPVSPKPPLAQRPVSPKQDKSQRPVSPKLAVAAQSPVSPKPPIAQRPVSPKPPTPKMEEKPKAQVTKPEPEKVNLPAKSPSPAVKSEPEKVKQVPKKIEDERPKIPAEPEAPPPQVPHRHSSKLFVKKQKSPISQGPPQPSLSIISCESSTSIDSNRVIELAKMEEDRRLKEEADKRAKALQEQEKRFYEKLHISQQYKRTSADQISHQNPPPPPPPPKVDYEKPCSNQQRLDRLKAAELKERMKLREMERRKRQIEEEIEREKQHLASLLQLEPKIAMSPPAPPVPPRPNNLWKSEPLSLEETVRDLELTTQHLKNMAEKKSAENDEAIRQTAGTVREVAQVLLEAVNDDEIHCLDDDTDGYSEGNEDFSCGIEMPLSVMGGPGSGNVTPVHTQGELEDISVEEPEPPSPRRSTPLKSLLKKNEDLDDHQQLLQSSTVRERSCSPRKAVHFSDVEQIKIMSQESLVSTAPSDVSSNSTEPQTVNATHMTPTCTVGAAAPKPTTPQRNQLVE